MAMISGTNVFIDENYFENIVSKSNSEFQFPTNFQKQLKSSEKDDHELFEINTSILT